MNKTVHSIENNRLILEFMGCKIAQHTVGNVIYRIKHFNNITVVNGNYHISGMKYDISWDWLMPVVEKIEKLEIKQLPSFSQNNFCVSITNSFCQIISGDFMKTYSEFDRHGGSKIEATYGAVIEFIKWYNERKIN